MIVSGVFDLPWWGYVLVALALTHITIAAVTIFLHRHQAHRGLELHPIVSHFFRFWLWLTTGMITKEWVAIHRKHHAKCETEDDPHSPQVMGLNTILWRGVEPYRKEAQNQETLAKYGVGVPDDWVERNLYAPHNTWGISAMAVINVALFGILPGMLIFAVQMIWIPLFAAGVINGIGHYWGYRNFACEDASTNIVPWGILIGGEELHNNHHAYGSSARLSNKWYEFDIGWFYIRTLEIVGLAKVKHVAPTVRYTSAKPVCDKETLQAIITHRYDVMAKFVRTFRGVYLAEMKKTVGSAAGQKASRIKRWLHVDSNTLPDDEKAELNAVLKKSTALNTIHSMGQELTALWQRSTISQEQLVKHLDDWCKRAESSDIAGLRDFSRRLRRYA